MTALTGHSQVIETLRCSFPKAVIGDGAQHLSEADGGYADKDEAALAAMVLVAGVLR